MYVYGTGSVAYVDNAWLYSSGPVSHGLYAGGNGTVYGTNIEVYSGGNRCSAFSGDNPAGYIHITDAVAHTDGIGSAVCYALGLCNMTNVIGHASRSPAMVSFIILGMIYSETRHQGACKWELSSLQRLYPQPKIGTFHL
jgi:hypothetical protein